MYLIEEEKMPDCIVPGCRRNAVNNLGVRLRRPPQADAHWSPNTNAFVCDQHARRGARITLVYEQADNGRPCDAPTPEASRAQSMANAATARVASTESVDDVSLGGFDPRSDAA